MKFLTEAEKEVVLSGFPDETCVPRRLIHEIQMLRTVLSEAGIAVREKPAGVEWRYWKEPVPA